LQATGRNFRVQWYSLTKETRTILFRKRDETIAGYYEMQVSVCVCSDVNDLMEELVFPHHPEECRLFINATNLRLRAVLLQNGSLKP
jgi:hypothetical protein